MRRSTLEGLSQSKAAGPYRRTLRLVAATGLLLTTLACGLIQPDSWLTSERLLVLTRLPTLTPTRLPTLTPTLSATPMAVAGVSEPALPPASPVIDAASGPADSDPAGEAVDTTVLPKPTDSPAPQPTNTPTAPIVEDRAWSFDNLSMATEEDVLVIYGEVINNTGASQQLDVMGGLFFDNQGQVIADDRNIETHWSAEVVPPGGRVPFEVVVDGIQTAADFKLNVEAQQVENP